MVLGWLVTKGTRAWPPNCEHMLNGVTGPCQLILVYFDLELVSWVLNIFVANRTWISIFFFVCPFHLENEFEPSIKFNQVKLN